MFHSRVHIEAGDLVIVFMTRDNMLAITVTPGDVLHNKYGQYSHDDLIGIKFGSKVHSPAPHPGYIYVLRPTPELWTLSLPHRTQIVYTHDIAYISMRLCVRPGGKVLEAGTGSGSVTHGLSRSVGPRGKVHSCEYHLARYEKAKAEFQEHGLNNVDVEHRNVCRDGFGGVQDVEAVFLDLPAPWEAIPHVVKILRSDMITKVCCFSPCLEQVLKTVSTLRSEGFEDVFTEEVLIRTHELAPPPPLNSSHMKTISSIVDGLQVHEQKKMQRRMVQMKTARERTQKRKERAAVLADTAETVETAEVEEQIEVWRQEEVNGDAAKRKLEENMAADDTRETKKRRRSFVEETAASAAHPPGESNLNHISTQPAKPPAISHDENTGGRPTPLIAEVMPLTTTTRKPRLWNEPEALLPTAILTKPTPEMRGHTSYLTFASYYPVSIRTQLAAQRDHIRITRKDTPVGGASRVAELVDQGRRHREGTATTSPDSEYGGQGIDEAIGSLTEEQYTAMYGRSA